MASNYSVFDADGQALRMGWHRMALSLARGGGLVSGEITVQIWIGAKEYSRIAGTP